jgi:peptide/nickel transport system substrate-binding protein
MPRRVVLLFLSIASAVFLLISCSTSSTTTTPAKTTSATTPPGQTTAAPATTTAPPVTQASEKPKYGGTLNMTVAPAITVWDPTRQITGIFNLEMNSLWEGDWTKGPAGGYGTKESDWGFGNNDIFSLKAGMIAESWKWSVDADKKVGTIVYQIRQGVRWGLNKDSEASRLVNGREVTADDVVFSLKRGVTWNLGFVFSSNAELRTADIQKTGPREVTINVPYSALYNAITRFGDAIFIIPPEVVNKYGDMSDWKNQVGTGAFMITDYVTDSMCTAARNPNFFLKNPIGPGKGDQLPYVDKVKVLAIPDTSTRNAALRTGKLDLTVPLTYDDANDLRKTQPKLTEIKSGHWQGRGSPYFLRTDTKPLDDVRVRRAMNMAIDRQSVLQGQYGGNGELFPFPFAYVKEYDPLYYKMADWTPEIKNIYTYNPEGAKKLLAEAGYPNGFKTQALVDANSQVQQDMTTIYVRMWKAIGIDVEMVLRDPTTKGNMSTNWTHLAITPDTTGPVAVFPVGNTFTGIRYNLSIIKDDKINQYMADVRTAAITDLNAAMGKYREMTKYALEQAWLVPDVGGPQSLMYWPWIKNYSGEITIGYDDATWPQYIWIDQDLKTKMGY